MAKSCLSLHQSQVLAHLSPPQHWRCRPSAPCPSSTTFPTPTTSTIRWCAPLFTVVSYIQLRYHYHTNADKYKYSLVPSSVSSPRDSHTAFAVSHPRENQPCVCPYNTCSVVKFELDVVSCSTSRSSCCQHRHTLLSCPTSQTHRKLDIARELRHLVLGICCASCQRALLHLRASVLPEQLGSLQACAPTFSQALGFWTCSEGVKRTYVLSLDLCECLISLPVIEIWLTADISALAPTDTSLHFPFQTCLLLLPGHPNSELHRTTTPHYGILTIHHYHAKYGHLRPRVRPRHREKHAPPSTNQSRAPL